MKKLNIFAALLAVPFIFASMGAVAKEFKGTITYKVTVTGSDVTDEVKAMMPKTMVVTIKDNKSRTEMVMGMGKIVTIIDADARNSVVLMDMMGQKMAIQSTTEDIEEDLEKGTEMTVEKFPETKNILDYSCKKAVIHAGEGMDITVFYTDELGTGAIYFDKPEFKDIDGVMLEYEIPQQGINMKFTAISVEKKNVSDTEFEIPAGYETKSREEMQGMFGF